MELMTTTNTVGVAGILFIAVVLAIMFGCKVEPEEIIKRTDMYYNIIKTVVNEPEIRPLIKDDDILKLQDIERQYIETRKIITSNKDSTKVIILLDCGISVCKILDGMQLAEDREKEIAAIRLGIAVLRASLVAREVDV